MRLVCHLQSLLDEHEISQKDFAADAQFDARTVRNLLRENWNLEPNNYVKLLRYAFDQGWGPLFELEHHPIWRTFQRDAAAKKGPETRLYGGTAEWDAKIEHNVQKFLRHLGGSPQRANAKPTARSIEKQMKETNCIFVGSPKKNPATEIALCLLAGATPFDNSPANRKNVPVQIVGAELPDGKPSAILVPNRTEHGFRIGLTNPQRIEVDWKRPEEYEKWHGEAWDAAVVVVCRSPLGTTKGVTTILLMGYSGLATQSVARQLTHDGWPPLTEEQLAHSRGRLHFTAYRFQFKKPRRGATVSEADPRFELDGTGEWWDPSSGSPGAK